MTLVLTPTALAAAYEYLRATAPFKGWKLPHADEVEFGVTLHRDRSADHCVYQRTKNHIIRVSSYYIKTTSALIEAIAHEMVHAKQEQDSTTTRAAHNTEFKRLSRVVCRRHGWDVERFVL